MPKYKGGTIAIFLLFRPKMLKNMGATIANFLFSFLAQKCLNIRGPLSPFFKLFSPKMLKTKGATIANF